MGIGALIGGALGAVGSMSAADTQASAANAQAANQRAAGQQALGILQGGLGQSQSYFAPYVQAGHTFGNALTNSLPYLTNPYQPTMQQLEQTPGYQFTLGQGLNATQNAMTAMGLGRSGAAAKAAAQYATGLAQNTYNQNAQIYQNGQQNIGNLLTNLYSTGQNAATNAANNQYSYNSAMGNALTGQANNAASTSLAGATAGASGIMGATGAINNGINNYLGYNALTQMMAKNNGQSTGIMGGSPALGFHLGA